MKNWKTIVWLMLFFPIGIYFMFKETKWTKGIKYLITAVLVIVTTLLAYSGLLLESFYISGLLILISGIISTIYSFTRNKQHKASIAILFLGLVLFSGSTQQMDTRAQERFAIAEQARIEEETRIENERQQALLAEATSAVEQAEEEISRENYDKAFTKVSALSQKDRNLADRLDSIDKQLISEEKTKEATILVEKAEKENTRSHYEKAASAIQALPTKNSELAERIVKIEKLILAHEKQVEEAETSLSQAETSKDRKGYKQAYLLVTSLPHQDDGLIKRLETLDSTIEKQEKQIAQEKKLAEEKAAEEQAAIELAEIEQTELEQANAVQVQEATIIEYDYDNSVDLYEEEQGAIKGSNSGIYHVPGSTYYDRTTNVVEWFHTIEEAEAAGYRAPKR